MAEIISNPIQEIFGVFKTTLVSDETIDADHISFGNSNVGAIIPWIAFKPMTNYTWLQARDLSNNENGIIVNIQVECYAKTESAAMELEDATKQALFNMGFYSTGFAQRFKNNNVYRYIGRYDLRYLGELNDLS